MGVTSRLQLPWPELTDLADGPDGYSDLAHALDNAVIFSQGPLSGLPVSSPSVPGIQGRLYATNDQSPNQVFYDFGTGWFSIGAVLAGSIGTLQLADRSVTTIKIALGAVTNAEIADATIVEANVADGAITFPKLESALKPSQGAGASAEALRALGTAAGMAAPGIHASQHAPGGADPLPSAVSLLPLGAVIDYPYASGDIPPWSLLPVGQQVNRSSYAALHVLAANAGYPHGNGNGSTTFNLPDYRGRVGIGKDDMGGTAASRITVAISSVSGAVLGAVGGAEGVTLSVAQLPAHNHGGSTGPPAGSTVAEFTGSSAIVTGLGGWLGSSVHVHSIPLQGGGGVHPNVQPVIVVNKIMRVL